jgi:hypothetical protein
MFTRLIDILQHRYWGKPVYVSGDLILYFVEGDPKQFVVPDVFVVPGIDPKRRETFKTWEEERFSGAVISEA